MSKVIKGLVITGLSLALPMAAMAATFSNVQFDNGDVTVSGTGGSTVNAKFHIIVPVGQVIEYIQTDVIGDSLAPVDTSVGGSLGLQEGTHDVTVSVTLPPNTGTYTLNVKGAGIYGGVRAVSADDASAVTSTGSFGSALRVVADSDNTTNNGGGSTAPTWLSALLAQIQAQTAAILASINSHAAPVTPAPAGVCADLAAYGNLYQGATGQQVVQLQGLLLSKGASIPALAAGASFGYFGPQTAAALASVKSTNHCQ